MILPDDSGDLDAVDEQAPDSRVPRPTRTQQTRAATAVNQLGVRLTMLSSAELDRLELPERVREEIEVCQKLKPRSRGRQNRLIGQLLRAEDHEGIRERVDSLKENRRAEVQQERISDQWLTRLVEEGDPAVEALIASYPLADRQRLRSLVRSARQDPEARKAKRARRELLRTIRALRA
jgi:ribosome-associated protein